MVHGLLLGICGSGRVSEEGLIGRAIGLHACDVECCCPVHGCGPCDTQKASASVMGQHCNELLKIGTASSCSVQ